MESYYPHSFEAEVVHHNVGSYVYTVVFLAPDLVKDLPFDKYPRLRFEGELNDALFEGAWQPVRGRWYVMLSKTLLKEARLSLGDTARVRFLVTDQDYVEVPPELSLALAENVAAAEVWESLSAGKRRGFAHRVLSAKTAPTKAKRVAEVLKRLLELGSDAS